MPPNVMTVSTHTHAIIDANVPVTTRQLPNGRVDVTFGPVEATDEGLPGGSSLTVSFTDPHTTVPHLMAVLRSRSAMAAQAVEAELPRRRRQPEEPPGNHLRSV